MANYNSFIFEGHGTSERTGSYDPGASANGFRENDLADKIATSAMNYLKPLGLSIHRDENNYADFDISGNTYMSKAGVTVHINAGGGTGVECYVPMREGYLGYDFELVADISNELKIPNRGVRSRDYDSELTYNRTNGVKLNGKDYYKEIRDAWSVGVSLNILEVGFIDTSDVHKINSNIDKIGFAVAKYIANLCGKTLEKPVVKPPVRPNVSRETYYRVVAGSFKNRNEADKRAAELKSKGYDTFIDKFEK